MWESRIWLVCLLAVGSLGSSGWVRAATTSSSSVSTTSTQVSVRRQPKLSEILIELINRGTYGAQTYATLQAGMTRVISDRYKDLPSVVGREKEMQEILKILLRIQGAKTPIILGEPGVGKTALIEGLAQLIREGRGGQWHILLQDIPPTTKILETNASQLFSFAQAVGTKHTGQAVELFLDIVRQTQKAARIPLILFVDEFNELDSHQVTAFKAEIDRKGKDSVRIIGASNHNSFQLLVKHDAGLESKFSTVAVEELSLEDTETALRKGWIELLEKKYHVSFDDLAIKTSIRLSTEAYPERKRPDAPIRFLQDLAISVGFERKSEPGDAPALVVEADVNRFASALTHLPINPSDSKALVSYIEAGRAEIKKRVIGQDSLVNMVVDLWQSILMADPARASRSAAILGTTGTGKSFVAESLAQVFLDGSDRVLTIEANAFQDEASISSLLGAPNGYISSDKTRGVLPEYLAGRGKGSGIIIINEVEKAHPKVLKRLMEMLEKSVLTAGDGKIEHLGRHLIVLTSNRGADKIFTSQSHLASAEETIKKIASYSESDIKRFFTESRGYAANDQSRLPPEIVNRINRWGVAKPLFFEEALLIAQLQINRFVKGSMQRHGIELTVSPEVARWITQSAYTPADGARVIVNRVESTLTQVLSETWKNLDSTRGAKIAIRLGGTEQVPALIATDAVSGNALGEVQYPAPPQFMAITDPRFMETLRTLEEKVKSEIQGQDDIVAKMASYTRMRAMRPLDPRPMVYGFFGLTGTGKTELARVYAKYLYGSYERAHVLEFGKVQNRHDLANIFNPPKGIVGSDSPSPFEQLLDTFPDGGVVVFDEMWNMGRAAPAAEREALFQYFYALFDEGKWTNEHGKTYDLSKWTMIITGNAGEKEFKDAPSDDLKEAVWKEVNTRENLKKILMQGGLPEAFVNRIGEMALFKPLTATNRVLVQSKFLKRIILPIAETNGVRVEFDAEFEALAARLFFPAEDGARGNRRFIENELSSFVTDAIFQNMEAIQKARARGETPVITVSITHDLPEKPWATEANRPSGAEHLKIELVAKIQIGEENQSFSRSVTPTSAPRIDIVQNSRRVAAHEGAGHALVGEHLGNPDGPVVFVTIESAGGYGGYVRFDGSKKNFLADRQDLGSYLRRMAVDAAGYVGQNAQGFERDWGWSADLEAMRRLAFDAIVAGGLIEGMEFVAAGKDSASLQDEFTKSRISEISQLMITAAIELARKVLEDKQVQKQAELAIQALIDRGHLSGDEYRQAIGEYRLPEKQWSKWTDELVQAIQKAAKSPVGDGCASLLSSR